MTSTHATRLATTPSPHLSGSDFHSCTKLSGVSCCVDMARRTAPRGDGVLASPSPDSRGDGGDADGDDRGDGERRGDWLADVVTPTPSAAFTPPLPSRDSTGDADGAAVTTHTHAGSAQHSGALAMHARALARLLALVRLLRRDARGSCEQSYRTPRRAHLSVHCYGTRSKHDAVPVTLARLGASAHLVLRCAHQR
jgi:hypothetical protein